MVRPTLVCSTKIPLSFSELDAFTSSREPALHRELRRTEVMQIGDPCSGIHLDTRSTTSPGTETPTSFPFPVENHIFHDKRDEIVELLLATHQDFSAQLNTNSMPGEHAMAPAGYTGFRWVTQLDPIWNAYLLGMVLSVSGLAEATRLGPEVVHSHRLATPADKPDIYTQDAYASYDRSSSETAEGGRLAAVVGWSVAVIGPSFLRVVGWLEVSSGTVEAARHPWSVPGRRHGTFPLRPLSADSAVAWWRKVRMVVSVWSGLSQNMSWPASGMMASSALG